jgi:hypothetical protein
LIRTNEELGMPGNPRDMIISAERCFPVSIRIGVPAGGFGHRHTEMSAWLDQNCGSNGWAMIPSRMRGVLKRCGLDLFPRRRTRKRFRCEVVRR